jgi:hypothetical protein
VSVVGRVQINRPGATVVNPPTPFEDPVPVDPSGYLALIVADGATAAWPLDEADGTLIYADAIGSLAASLPSGSTSDWASLPIGPASGASPHFLGTPGVSSAPPENLAVTVAHDAMFEVGVGDFAIEVWLTPDLLAPSYSFGELMGLIAPSLGSYVHMTISGPGAGVEAGRVVVQDAASIDASTSVYSASGYDDEALHHWVCTRRGGTYFLIVDGIEAGSCTPSAPVDFAAGGTHVLMIAGVDFRAVAADSFLFTLHGQIAWAAWYPVGLTAEQAMAHFIAGGGV